MNKILLVFGTRPEAIKMAPLVKEFQKQPESFLTLVCVTGQHRKMLDQVLDLFEITPDFDLNIMEPSQDLYDVTSRVLLGMREVLKKTKPNLILVHGDTSTSTAAALAAFYQKIPVGHVEAGLRTHNIYSPWPEEINRQITGRLASLHFAPTPKSKQNLKREGVSEETIFITGNTVIDALFWVLEKIGQKDEIKASVIKELEKEGLETNKISAWENRTRKLVLITGHRRENFGPGFRNICEAIKELGERNPEVDFVYPMHLNPSVREAVKTLFSKQTNPSEKDNSDLRITNKHNVFFTEPLDYLPFVYLMSNSHLILTDSGGIQEEAPSLGKPVLVMRNNTERPEAVEAGAAQIVGANKEKIIAETQRILDGKELYKRIGGIVTPYGDGKACERIIEIVKNGQSLK